MFSDISKIIDEQCQALEKLNKRPLAEQSSLLQQTQTDINRTLSKLKSLNYQLTAYRAFLNRALAIEKYGLEQYTHVILILKRLLCRHRQ